jgi:nucleoid-associated protein YgaU
MSNPLLYGLVRKLQFANKAILLCVVVVFGLMACSSSPKSSPSDTSAVSEAASAVEELDVASSASKSSEDSTPNTSPTSSSSQSSGGPTYSPAVDGTLPAQYRIRGDDSFKRIAARPEVYGDENLWHTLYEANRGKLPNPNDPGLIVPDIVLDIPSIQGETRSGLWEEGGKYPTLSRVAAASIPPNTYPAQYRIRSQDTFRGIAGRTWAYNDPSKWTGIYEANRSKLPDPNDPDRLMPGIVLDIPSIQGETRTGLWNEEYNYPVFTPSGR